MQQHPAREPRLSGEPGDTHARLAGDAGLPAISGALAALDGGGPKQPGRAPENGPCAWAAPAQWCTAPSLHAQPATGGGGEGETGLRLDALFEGERLEGGRTAAKAMASAAAAMTAAHGASVDAGTPPPLATSRPPSSPPSLLPLRLAVHFAHSLGAAVGQPVRRAVKVIDSCAAQQPARSGSI